MLPTGNAGGRRRFIANVAALSTAASVRRAAGQARPTLAIGTTPVFLDDQIGLLHAWRAELEAATGHAVSFVQRGSYREITDLLLAERVDAAWVCGFPYVVHAARLKLVAVPLYQGAPLYRSYLIVPALDTETTRILDLGGRVFAYSDPQSNSGYLVPRAEILRAGQRPDALFRKTFFTYGHRKVIEAVAAGVAQGGAVDGYVWDTLDGQHADLTRRTRIAWRSPLFGFPPIVARPSLPPETIARLQRAFTGMVDTEPGRALLRRLNLDGFVEGSPDLFAGIGDLVRLTAAAA